MEMLKTVLVTGGAGYIGSHTIVELLQEGFKVVVYDNLSNSSTSSLDNVEKITGNCVDFVRGDICNLTELQKLFSTYDFDSVIHFAGLKSIGESIEQPLRYYENNVSGTLQLLRVMAENNVKTIVFSSSATVYGNSDQQPVSESLPTKVPSNAYGESKLIIENVLKNIHVSDNSWRIAILRYFNPMGAHPSGLIGENPVGIPSNLMPYITFTAAGELDKLLIYGGDYDTPDGSGIRDYIHVVDLAKGHLSALKKLDSSPGMFTVNLGTGKGYSVLQVVDVFQRVNNVAVAFEVTERRKGDVAVCYADVSYAKKLLDWQASLGLEAMCKDSWNWQLKNTKSGAR